MKIKVGAEKLLLALPSGDGTQPTRNESNFTKVFLSKKCLVCIHQKHMSVNLLCQKNGIR